MTKEGSKERIKAESNCSKPANEETRKLGIGGRLWYKRIKRGEENNLINKDGRNREEDTEGDRRGMAQ